MTVNILCTNLSTFTPASAYYLHLLSLLHHFLTHSAAHAPLLLHQHLVCTTPALCPTTA